MMNSSGFTGELQDLLEQGEGVYVEFKRVGAQVGTDVFETICSFANSFGGTLLLGVSDEGKPVGVGTNDTLSLRRNMVNVVNNPKLFDPPVALDFHEISMGNGTVIKVWVPPSPMVHRYKNTAYERVEDADIKVRSSVQLAQLYIRKQNIYTERQIFPHVQIQDLDMSVLENARNDAARKREDHPWLEMDDMELLRSAGLYAKDFSTGEVGFNLAAVLLLGCDVTIKNIIPAYKTDAIWQDNPDVHRYDDRTTVVTNLVDSYQQLAEFCRKHLPDRFFTEDDRAVSVRDIIVREVVVNSLIHREFSSPYPAKITITRDQVLIENASRAVFSGELTPESINPYSKNPIIAAFFSNIGLAEELGSGTRALFKYSPLYSGKEPELKEGNVFLTRIPVSYTEDRIERQIKGKENDYVIALILALAKERDNITLSDVESLGIARRTAQRALAKLVRQGLLKSEGATTNRIYHNK